MLSNFYSNNQMGHEKSIQEAILAIFVRQESEGLINQKMLSEMKGCSEAAISNWLHGNRRMHEDTILFFCRALGVKWQDLDVGIDLPQDPPPIARLKHAIDALQGAPEEMIELAETVVAGIHKASRAKVGTPTVADEESTGTLPALYQHSTDTPYPKPSPVKAPEPHVKIRKKAESPKIEPVIDYSAPAEEDDSNEDEPPAVKSNVVPFFQNYDEMRDVQTVLVPMWDYIAASPPDGSEPEFIGYFPVVHSFKKETWKVIRLQGESMEPEFMSGDFIIVDTADQVQKGKCVVAYIEGEGGTFKKYGGINPKTGLIKLISINKTHPVIELPADKVRITAVYIETTRARRGK